MKLDKLKNFWMSSASKTGGMGKKVLETLIPDEVLQNSLFIGSFYEMARNMESLTDEGEGGEGKTFFLKKGGGQVIDLATTPLTGMPITMWSALVCDGCRVASWSLKTAVRSSESEEEVLSEKLLGTAADGIERVGDLSRNVHRFFDTPGKAEALSMVESSSSLLDYTKENSALLGGEAVSRAAELHRLARQMTEKAQDGEVNARFMENATVLINILCESTGSLKSDLKTFITSPNKENFVMLSLNIERSFKKVPFFFYKETTKTIKKFPEYARYLPRPDKELIAMAGIMKGLSKETGGKFTQYLDHYKGILDK